MRSDRTLLVSLLLATLTVTLPTRAQQSIAAPALTGNSASDPQAISKTGLLPVYGVALRLDPSWIDGGQFPSQSVNAGANAVLQQVWGALQPAGFSVLRVGIDIRDPGAASNQAANLCLWAKNNNVRLILMLTGSDDGQPLGADYPRQSATFVKSLVTLLRDNNSQYFNAYAQIAAYQLEDALNHAGRHGGMAANAAQQVLLGAAQQLRQAEQQALEGAGVDATPLLVNASFDFELIRARMIAGATMNDDSYGTAYKGLTRFLSPLAASPNIDLVGVDWLPGSLSAGGVDKFPRLLRDLLRDLNGKQLVLTTGFSTAFHDREDQKRFDALAFATLGDFRASVGVDCPFVGLLFRDALNGKEQNPDPPRPSLPAEMASWDWPAKADDLGKMWAGGQRSDDMAWWLKKTENNLGLMAMPGSGNGMIAATPAQQTLTQIAAAVGQASAAGTYGAQAGTSPSAGMNLTYPGNQANPGGAATPYGTQPITNLSADTTGASQVTTSGYPSPNAGSPGTSYAAQPGTNPSTTYATAGNYANPGVVGGATTYGAQATGNPGSDTSGSGTSGSALGSALVNSLEATAQQGLMGLLNAVFQRLGNQISGVPGSGFSSSGGTFPPPNAGAFSGVPGSAVSPAGGTFSSPNAGAFSADAPGSGITSNQAGPATSGFPGSTSTGLSNQSGSVAPNPGDNGSSSFAGNAAGSPTQPVIQLVAQNASFQPNNPQVQDAITLVVSVANPGKSDAPGVQVFAVNDDSTSLAQSESIRIAPGSRATATLSQWIPTDPRTYHITFQVVDGFGNQQASLPLDVSVSVRQQSRGSTGGTGGTNAGSGNAGGTGGSTNAGSATPGGSGSSGSATLGSVATPPVVSAPPGVVSFSGVHVGSFGQPVVPGNPTPVSVSLSNRFLVPLNNVQATMVLDGKALQTQVLPVLLPGQTRSVLFPAVTISQPGRHEMNILLHSQRPGERVQLSVVTSHVVVPEAQSPQAGGGVRSILAGHIPQPGPQTSGTAVRGFALGTPPNSAPRPGGVRSILIPVFGNAPASAANGQPPSHALSAVLSDKTPPSLARPDASLPPPHPLSHPAQLHPDLVIKAQDIRYQPSRPVAGRRILFGARVLNLGDGVARRAAVVFKLVADGRQVAGSPPLQFDLEPKSAHQATWEAQMPSGRQVLLWVFVYQNQNSNVVDREASIEIQAAPFRPGAARPPRRTPFK